MQLNGFVQFRFEVKVVIQADRGKERAYTNNENISKMFIDEFLQFENLLLVLSQQSQEQQQLGRDRF